ncbi:AraC family transcriptional regulator [Membranihabitans maritimus]|uniref:AraC family transcriptional regulator n=1 Tax=Membranihabitans maritimus TaxID=2904244 RepID=UPI001F014BA5|nr:AraC family transcriptional regulator [Membranihabitans maritimus]
MKAPLSKSPIPDSHAFICKRLQDPHFDANWHFHPEYQLFTVLKGSGTRFVGDNVQTFGPGDLVFTGPDLPHLWRSDPEYFQGNNSLNTDGIVIYFNENLVGKKLLGKSELVLIRTLFYKSHRGIKIDGSVTKSIKKDMLQLVDKQDFDSIIHLLNILNKLSKIENIELLASPEYQNNFNAGDTDRMNRVHSYVLKNFHKKITLKEVAEIANMTPSSFSRYFTAHANKTFSNFVSEIRIGYACKLLIEKNAMVSEACYASGFQTQSNFNQQFKNITGRSPSEYKAAFERTNWV